MQAGLLGREPPALERRNDEIEADTPRDAAEKARHYQTKPGTSATVFEVMEVHPYAIRRTGDPVTNYLTPDTD
jgi:hypothetical protein